MKQTIYIDVLFCVNLVIDYIMLISVKHIMSLSSRRIRLLAAAAAGGTGSFIILLPPMNFFISTIFSIAEAAVMIAVAFMPVSKRAFAKSTGLLFCVSFCFCGAMTAVTSIFLPRNTIVRNGTVYIGISPFFLIGLTLIFYAALRIFYSIMNNGSLKSTLCRVEIEHNGKAVQVDGMVDTGCTLHEPFSGECVIVGKAEIFKDISDTEKYMNAKYEDTFTEGIRLVPFRSVGGSGLIPAFKPDKIKLITKNKELNVSAYLALCSKNIFSENCEIIVPAELVMKGS